MFILRLVLKILLRIVIGFFVLSAASVLLFRWVPVPVTPLMLIRCVEQKKQGQGLRLRHDWVPLSKISPKLQLAVVCSEDQNFLRHYGFDFDAIEKAMQFNNDNERRKRGASTISQQTAKNVFLWPGRSYVRKGLEAYFTLLIELFWSKERIMEIYLNSIEMGKGIYGAQAAAEFWFHKDAANLNADESAALASILPAPLRYVANPPSPYILKRKAWIRKQMNDWGGVLNYYQNEEEKQDNNKREKK